MRMLLICFTLCRDIVRLIFIFTAFQFFQPLRKRNTKRRKVCFTFARIIQISISSVFPIHQRKLMSTTITPLLYLFASHFFRYRPFLAFSALNHQNCVIVRDPFMCFFILRHSKNRCRNHIKLSQGQINGLVYTIRKVKRFSICYCV